MKSNFTLRTLTAMAVAFVFVLSSCSTSNDVVSNRAIQKRKYNDGWFLSFQKNQKKDNAETVKSEDLAIEDVAPVTTDKAIEETAVAAANDQEVIETLAAPATRQKAERAEKSERPANFRSNRTADAQQSDSAANELKASDFDQEVEEAAAAAKASKKGKGASGKSQLIALLLCIFVGTLGIHRFYLGYTTAGIIQLLTLGACGIWTLIDLIRIITGDLKPANGDYDETI